MRRGPRALLALLAVLSGCFSDHNRLITTGVATAGETSTSTSSSTGSSTSGTTTTGEAVTTGATSSTGAVEPPEELVVDLVDSDNDALQDPDGSMKVAFGWTTLNSPSHWGGMRFAVPKVPQGATIVAAEFVVFCDADNTDSPRLEVYGELAPNPGVFTATANDIESRPRTKASVFWTGDDIGAGWQTSPSLVSVIQELVDQDGWAPSQHMVLILDATAEAGALTPFEYRQWDHPGAFAPKLGIRYYPP